MTGGSKLHDIKEFKHFLSEDETSLAQNLTNQLIVYATGAPVSFSDRDQVATILQPFLTRNFGTRSLITEIILRKSFRRK